MTYLTNLSETKIQANNSSRSQVSGWDNCKVKSAKRYNPRGSFFKRFQKAEYKAEFDDITESLESAISSIRGQHDVK